MISRFKLSSELFFSNFLLNLLIALQLCSVLIFGNMVIAMQNASMECYRLTANVNQEDSFIYMPSDESIYLDENAAIARYRDVITLSMSIKYDVGVPGIRAREIYYGKDISEMLKHQLVAGEWFTDAPKEEGVINCVISGDREQYPIGSLIEARGWAGFTVIDGVYYDDFRPLTFRVCGYVDDTVMVMQPSLSYSELTAEDLFKKYKTSGSSIWDTIYGVGRGDPSLDIVEMVILYGESLPDIVPWDFRNSMITLSDELTAEEREAVIGELRKEAMLISFGELRQRSLQAANDELMAYLPMLICFIAMGSLGIVCVSVMTMQKNRATFKIYINCGMRKKDGIGLLAGYLLLVLVLTLLLFAAVWLVLLKLQILPWRSMLVDGNNYVFSAICILCIIVGMLGIEGSILNRYYRVEEEGIC